MVSFTLNGKSVRLDVEPDTPLLWAIRDDAGLTGTKYGCGAALCGACTIHLDNQPVRSCVTAASDAQGKSVTTIEGLQGKVAEAIRKAWIEIDVAQCGYCQSGQIMSAVALLSAQTAPTDKDIDEAMAGNLCRCATYVRIRKAIHRAAEIVKV